VKDRSVLKAAAIFFCALLGFALLSSDRIIAFDFHAFYCAGTVMRDGGNPYYASDLQRCEQTRTGKPVNAGVLPAPQPPYDLVLFKAVSALPFSVAKPLWGAVLGIVIAFAFAGLLRLGTLSMPLVLCVLLGTLIAPSLALGQLIPIYAVGAIWACVFAREGRDGAAALCAALTLIDPHLGLPLCVALAVWRPKTRLLLAASLAALAAVSLRSGGLALNVEYVRVVLPLHAMAEAAADGQLSLTAALHQLGVADSLAVTLGSVSYAAMAIAGIVIGGFASRRFHDAAFIVAVPAATSVFGGTFVHGDYMIAAIPLAVLLLKHMEKQRAFFAGALVLLCVPWYSAWEHSPDLASWFALAALTAFYILWDAGGVRVIPATLCSLGIFGALLALSSGYGASVASSAAVPHVAAVAGNPRYADAAWGALVRRVDDTRSPINWLIRFPTWFALAIVIASSLRSQESGVSGAAQVSRA
jgi:hypothetical protein